MIKDIKFPEIKDVYVAVVQEAEADWKVYLLNRGIKQLQNILVTSQGYGEKDGDNQKTSTLRHMIPQLDPGEYALIEPIQPEVFHLNNQYWVSFFIDKQLYDKKYIFVPDSIISDNLSTVDELGLQGVLHQ